MSSSAAQPSVSEHLLTQRTFDAMVRTATDRLRTRLDLHPHGTALTSRDCYRHASVREIALGRADREKFLAAERSILARLANHAARLGYKAEERRYAGLEAKDSKYIERCSAYTALVLTPARSA